MSDEEKKLSLLNDLSSITEREENVISSYCFHNIGKIIINDMYISIPIDTSLLFWLENGHMTIKVFNVTKGLFYFNIDCKDLYDFHLLIRGG